MLSDSILVVAHPDDEILWFSSVVDKVNEILFCYNDYPRQPALGEGRKRLLDEYPLQHVSSLGLDESMSFNGADWERPVTTAYGMEIVRGKKTLQRYRQNFSLLEERLAERLRAYRNVFTHNPWGEYGHEDHVQLFRVIETLQRRLSFRIWYSNYASNRSAALMFRYFSGFDTDYITLPTNPELAGTIKELYRRHGCWTWYADHRWFNEECFFEARRLPSHGKGYGRLFPVNMLKIDLPAEPEKPRTRSAGLWKRVRRRLKHRHSRSASC